MKTQRRDLDKWLVFDLGVEGVGKMIASQAVISYTVVKKSCVLGTMTNDSFNLCPLLGYINS
jgi:hypothetical protein